VDKAQIHSAKHNSPDERDKLFNRKIDIYGRENMQRALDLVSQELRVPLNITLPEDEKEEIDE
jgi:hypothetical protein